MEYFVIAGLAINLLVQAYYYMYMLQLNSYSYIKHANWIIKNFMKVVLRMIPPALAGIMFSIHNVYSEAAAVVLLLCSIAIYFPRGGSKVKFRLTGRVLRMFVTEFAIIALLELLTFRFFAIGTLVILNLAACVLCLLANVINIPIEKAGKAYYVSQAKKIINNMPDLIVIGVTGSYGKTSTKFFLEKILSKKYEVLATPKNYNTTLGVVKTIKEYLKPTHQIFICEMGAERLGEIKEICDIVKPKYGIITAIGPQHLETFKSLKNIIKTKFELADAVRDNGGKVFLNFDNEYIAKHDIKQEFASYGINDKQLDFAGLEIVTSSRGSDFKIHDKADKKTVSYNTKLIGAHNVINIVGAVAAAKELGVSLDDAVRQVKQIESVEHRLQLTRKNGFNIIDDSYNSNPVSSKKAVDTLAQFDGVKILVTPGMIELGKDERDYNYEFGKYAADYCDYVFLVNSRQAEYIYDGLKSKKYDESKIYRVSSPTEAVDKALKLGIKEEITILLENDLPDNY